MKLKVKKVNQGPVLAKGEVQVTDSTTCQPTGVISGSCTTQVGGGATVTVGAGTQNGGNASVTYNSPCNC
jgi:hypothetical protein